MSIKTDDYLCDSTERIQVTTKEGFYLVCKKCGHKFKEVKRVKTTQENLF